MATDSIDNIDGYNPDSLDLILGQAAEVLRIIGFAGDGLTIIGGLVPSLIVPVVDPVFEQPHIGTRDIDFCLSLALLEDGVDGYDRIENQLRNAGYTASEVSFRWVHPAGTEIEFFCASRPDRPPGRMFRPLPGRGRQTLGSRLTALVLEAGALLTAERHLVRRTVSLPRAGGLIEFEFPVTGPAGFLAAKVAALSGRDKNKDAYDIVWLLDAWPGGPRALRKEIEGTSAQSMPREVAQMRSQLAQAFSSYQHHGPRAYAGFVGTAHTSAQDRDALARHAHGAVQAFLAG